MVLRDDNVAILKLNDNIFIQLLRREIGKARGNFTN